MPNNVYGDKYIFVEADNMDDFQREIDSKACHGYELVTMMTREGSGWGGNKFVAAMTKTEKREEDVSNG